MFIHIIRDGRDVALSLSEVSWGPDDITVAAEKWASELRKARKRAKNLVGGTYMEIHYEDLVTDPEPVLRKVADFADLPWSDEMLDYPERAAERMRGEMERTLKPLGGGTITAEERTRQHQLVLEKPEREQGRSLEDGDVTREPQGVRGGRGRPPQEARLRGRLTRKPPTAPASFGAKAPHQQTPPTRTLRFASAGQLRAEPVIRS